MTKVLVSKNATLRTLLERAESTSALRTYPTLAAAPVRECECADAIIFDEATASFMELFACQDLFGDHQKLVILTEKRAAMIGCFSEAVVFSYPVDISEVSAACRDREEISA